MQKLTGVSQFLFFLYAYDCKIIFDLEGYTPGDEYSEEIFLGNEEED
jgi:hypothetical protein